MTHEQLREKAFRNPDVKAEFEAIGPEFELLRSMIAARQRAGLSQTQVAHRMGTRPPAIARLESPGSQHSPSVRTLSRYAEAVGCRLEVRLVPESTRKGNTQ